jgi:hypothetical protein
MKRASGWSWMCLLVAGVCQASETVRYVALVDKGKVAGKQEVTHGDDGVTRVAFVFKNNGRGPELEEEFVLADDGTFKTYLVKGTSTFGAPVDESFSREGDTVHWRSTSEKGEMTLSGTGMYLPLSGTPNSFSVAMAALAKCADGKLPLIPSGTLTMRKLAEAEVARGMEERKVQLLALTGVGFTPIFAWVNTGATPRLFAWIFPGFLQLIEEGWEGNASALESRQQQAENEALVALQHRLAHPLPGATVIGNARVFDSEHARLGAASDVYLYRSRISAILPAGSPRRGIDNVIDAGGRVLLPGLFDMHAHISRWEGGLHLAAGVTTVRDMGNDNATLQQLIDEVESGRLMAPHVVTAGFIEGESPMSARLGFVISDLQQAKNAIDWYAEHGYRQVKIYNSFPKALLHRTVAYAHWRGLRVSGHVPAFLRAQDVVEQGYDEIQHINQVLLNFFVTPETDTRTLQRFYLVADKTADLDFDSKPVQDFIELLKSKQIVIDPTLATFDFLRQRPGELSEAYAAVAEHMPPDVQRGWRVAEMNIPDDATAARYTRSYEKMIEFTGRLYRAGVPLVAGTDALAGFTLHRELELYVQAGLTPAQALQIATWNGAKYAHVLADRGSIERGKLADLVLIDGDPTSNIGELRKVALVVKAGKAYYPAEIYEALGIRPFAEPVPVQAAAAD